MDRYVIREPRAGVDHPEGNQMISFPASNTGNAFRLPQNMYYAYGPDTQGHMSHHSHGPVVTPAQTFGPNFYQHGCQMSGIDGRYLAAYNNASLLGTGQPEPPVDAFGDNYQNRNLAAPQRNEYKYFAPQITRNVTTPDMTRAKSVDNHFLPRASTSTVQSKHSEVDVAKNVEKVQVRTRVEKLKELQKAGTRVFSGPVEKILKWNKSLQDIGVMVLYEVVGKCTSVRPGEHGAKNLVVRDESGPAMQVVYYEMDSPLPELTPPCTVRVVGRVVPGSSRLQAFSVRLAAPDDFASLPRRAALAARHVARLGRDYGAGL